MTDTVRTVIQAAYEDAGRFTEGEAVPDEHLVTGLRKFQTQLDGLVNGGCFGRVRARLITDDTTASENDRIQYNGATSATVTLPTTLSTTEGADPVPYDLESTLGAQTLDNEDTANRAPRDHALAEVAGTAQLREVYDALLGDWVQVSSLAVTDALPLARWKGEFIAMLTPKVALPGTVTPDMLANATRARIRIVMNATAPRRTATADSF